MSPIYNSPEEILEDYYNGKLRETYPILADAMDLLNKDIMKTVEQLFKES